MTVFLTLFLAGVLTILLPCILPLVPIVLGVSLAGKRKARPLVTVVGMVLSFVVFTFLLQVVLQKLVHLADIMRIATYYALFLFGVCFLFSRRYMQIALAALGAIPLFWGQGWLAQVVSPLLGVAAVALGGRAATRIQQLGADAQQGARKGLGAESLLSALVVGLTLGLVWVPCAGPALGFALTLVRDEPGPRALLALSAYAIGAAMPLLLIGYGGQSMVRSARWLNRYSGRIKQVSGALLVLSAAALQYNLFTNAQTWLADRTGFGNLGSRIEGRLFSKAMAAPMLPQANAALLADEHLPSLPELPKLGPAPELAGLGPWYNSAPLTMAGLRGKVVLVDFWTYSCINCLRTLPHMRELWAKFHDQPFVIVGVHAPEFVFEKSPANVADAIKRHGLDYPIAQDNDFGTWKAFGNRYWPAKYLIDAQGTIRYTHFGEGGDEATDAAIRSLLAEIGRKTDGPTRGRHAEAPDLPMSPETYLGPRGWTAFANRAGAPDARRHRYTAPVNLAADNFALVGDWQLLGGERQVLRSDTGEIRYHALAGQVNVVLGVESGSGPIAAEVSVDGKPTKRISVDRHDLYNLFSGPYGQHEIALKVRGENLAAYAFTFGG